MTKNKGKHPKPSRAYRSPSPTNSPSPVQESPVQSPSTTIALPTETSPSSGLPYPTKLPELPPGLNFTIPVEGAFNRESYTIWIGVFLLFFVWWVVQVITYAASIGKMVVRAPPGRRLVAKTWTQRLGNATNAGRDSFLVLLGAAMLSTAVGGTFPMQILSWVFVVVSVVWIISGVFIRSDALYKGMMLLAIPIVLVVYLLSFLKT
jgi:hypothetical protein